MNIERSFALYLQGLGVATLGQNLFIGDAPSSNKTQDSIWWLVESGGSKLIKAMTGESVKQYSINLYHRDRDYQLVKNSLYSLEETLSCAGCVQLEGFETIEVDVISFPIDQDLDSEDRKVGLLQINIKIYKEC